MSKIKINNQTINFGWLIGEIKAFHTKQDPAKLNPLGWFKVDMNIGDTLVNGDTTQPATKGEVISHNHKTISNNFGSNGYVGTIPDGFPASSGDTGAPAEHAYPRSYTWDIAGSLNNAYTTSTGGDRNQASGIYVEYWEYKGEQK